VTGGGSRLKCVGLCAVGLGKPVGRNVPQAQWGRAGAIKAGHVPGLAARACSAVVFGYTNWKRGPTGGALVRAAGAGALERATRKGTWKGAAIVAKCGSTEASTWVRLGVCGVEVSQKHLFPAGERRRQATTGLLRHAARAPPWAAWPLAGTKKNGRRRAAWGAAAAYASPLGRYRGWSWTSRGTGCPPVQPPSHDRVLSPGLWQARGTGPGEKRPWVAVETQAKGRGSSDGGRGKTGAGWVKSEDAPDGHFVGRGRRGAVP